MGLIKTVFVFLWRILTVYMYNPPYKTKTGKMTRRRGYILVGKERRYVSMSAHKDGTVDFTLKEMESATIPCAHCGKSIVIGELVTLYGVGDPSKVRRDAVIYTTTPFRVVGCLRSSCAECGADFQGRWMPNLECPGRGKVERVKSPFEVIAGGKETAVIVDLPSGEAKVL